MNSESPPPLSRRATRSGVPPLGHYLSEAFRYRTFAVYWSRADIKARNFETVLGRLWHYLNPLLFGLIYFVFIGILSGDMGRVDRLAFIVGNLYVWTYFATVITAGMGSVQGGGGGITAQTAIPRVVLPFAAALTAANLFLRSLIAYVPIHFIADRGLHWEMLGLPLLMLLTVVFGFGLSLLFAVANVYVRDISRLMPHFLRLWMYLSPTIWAYTLTAGEGTLDTLAKLNPMYWGMSGWTIGFGGSLIGRPSYWMTIAVFGAIAIGALVFGFLTFVSREDEFAIRV